MTTNVIICDDSGMARKQLARALPPDWPVVLTYAGNGREAIAALQQGLGEVLFLDLTMPEMDGYEATRQIRALNETTRRIPIIALTANAMVGDRRKCLAAGMDDYISKPLKKDAFLAMLHKWLVEDRRSA